MCLCSSWPSGAGPALQDVWLQPLLLVALPRVSKAPCWQRPDVLGLSLVAQLVKNLPAIQETGVRFLYQEDLLEKEMAIHFNILVWRIPWTEESGRPQSMGSQRVGHDWAANTFTLSLSERQVWGHLCRAVNPKPSSALSSRQLIKDQPDCLLLESEMGRIEDNSLHSYSSIKTQIKPSCSSARGRPLVPKVLEIGKQRPREIKSHIPFSEQNWLFKKGKFFFFFK